MLCLGGSRVHCIRYSWCKENRAKGARDFLGDHGLVYGHKIHCTGMGDYD